MSAISEYVSIGDTVRFNVITYSTSGVALKNADTPPWFRVYANDSDTSILSGQTSLRSGLTGVYRGSFVASVANGFAPSGYYEVHISGVSAGRVDYSIAKTFVIDDEYVSINDVYYADIKYIKDSTNSQDEYVVSWFKNGTPLSSGDILSPHIKVTDGLNGNILIDSTEISFLNDTAAVLYHIESSSITDSGHPYLVETSGTIASQNRLWNKIVGIDYI